MTALLYAVAAGTVTVLSGLLLHAQFRRADDVVPEDPVGPRPW